MEMVEINGQHLAAASFPKLAPAQDRPTSVVGQKQPSALTSSHGSFVPAAVVDLVSSDQVLVLLKLLA